MRAIQLLSPEECRMIALAEPSIEPDELPLV